jgi:hypothetical protein
MRNGPAHPADARPAPTPRGHRRHPSWSYWLPAAALLAVVLYLFFFLPLPDTSVLVTPLGTG